MLLLLLFHNSPVTPRYPFREEGFAHYPQTYPHRYVNRGVGEKIPGFFLGEEGPRAGAEVGRGEALSVWTEVWSGRGEALSVRPEAGQLPQRGSQVGVRCLPRAFHYKAVVGSSGKLTCLSLWERWHGEAVTERVSLWTLPSIGRPPCRGGYQPPGPRNSRHPGKRRSRSPRGLLPQSPPPAATAPSKREPKRTRRQGRGGIPFPPFDLLGKKFPPYFPFSVDNPAIILYDNSRRDIENHITGCVV